MGNYWQPEIMKDIGKYIERYNLYQRIKNRTKILVGKLIVNKIPEKLWIHLIMDFITKLLLVVYDRLSKIAYFLITTEEISVERLARLFRDKLKVI